MNNESTRLKSTVGMWIIFFVFLAILLSISIYYIHTAIMDNVNNTLPTQVFTVGDDVFSIKIPSDWMLSSSSDTEDGIIFKTANNYESLTFSPSTQGFDKEASTYLIELCDIFNESLSYTDTFVNGKRICATQIMLNNTYYFCGVMESGNTVLRFMYTASIMINEPSEIDVILGSLNYRTTKEAG